MKNWKVLSTKTLVDSPWLGVDEQVCELPNGKVINSFYMVRQPSWVLVLAQDELGNWILGRQYRHGVGRWFLEFPAGIIDEGEDPIQAAQRELKEETGYAFGEWKKLGSYPVNPDRQSSYFHIFVALGVKKVSSTDFDETEDIRLTIMSNDQLNNAITSGELEHPHHAFAWLLFNR